MDREILQRLYLKATGQAARSVTPLAGAGSNRRYYRVGESPTLIGVCGTSVDENKAFVYMARHFERKGLPVPHVYAVSDDYTCYLQEDLGDELLFHHVTRGVQQRQPDEATKALLVSTIRLLPKLQHEGAMGMDFSVCYPQPEFDRRSVMWDLNYFKYCFLKATGVDFREDRLEDDFVRLADDLLANATDTFMYRDFQSRNVMVRDGQPYFIDFQGGRKGPVWYDVASFLWQAKARFPQTLRDELIGEYLDAMKPYCRMSDDAFRSRLRLFVLFRTMQVLGAYGYRGYFERKPHFLQSIPFAIDNLRTLLDDGIDGYPYLTETLRRMTEQPQFVFERNKKKLRVRVVSFSYKKGIPQDPSGNGGGYVFDCRYVHNPGKYERYKHLTGLDEPVIRFLEDDGEILRFLEHVDALVDAHVRRYLERGFTSLMVSFGCTGGQHRSVYSAEHVARRVHDKWGVTVEVEHREQNISRMIYA